MVADKELKILYLEDWGADVELVSRALKNANLKFTLHVVANREDYKLALTEFEPDIILSDHTLASFNSKEALNLLKESGRHVPFVVVTGMIAEDHAVEILTQGAFDYLLKDQLKRLPKTIMNAIDITRIEQERHLLDTQKNEIIKMNKELDRFVYSASHDMRAPLTSLLGLIDMIQLENNDEGRLKWLTLMRTSIHNLEGMLNDMIDYSRNMRQEVEFTKINFQDVFQVSMNQLSFMDGANRIKCSLEVDGDFDFWSDRKRLGIIFNNFLSNAIKYHNHNEANPFIKFRVALSKTGAMIEIEDNGSGISDHAIDKIFDMFYRATTTKNGSGLGLYIVKEILEKLSGGVNVVSTLGKGTTFYVYVPNAIKA
ncbi:MAG TPA: ATP-binding protein [Cyclobacteriaceae bacterium]